MSQFTVGTYLATRLEQIGLKHYFVVPGDFNLVLLDRLLENRSMEQIGCTNELNASYAAMTPSTPATLKPWTPFTTQT
jgi:pyruvate decarboxylase